MDLLYFLDWCPVSTLPVLNGVWKADGLTWRSARDLAKPELRNLFERFPELILFEFALRLDGLFLFRIGLKPSSPPASYAELPHELSNIIKGLAGHRHDFHTYPYTVTTAPSSGWRRVCYRCTRHCREIAQKLRLTAAHLRDQLDVDLHIRPVEIEDPFADDFKQQTRKNFVALHQIIDPDNGDATLAQLRVRHWSGDGPSQRACLRLRALFAGKKDRCLVAYQRRRRWLNSLVPAMIYGALVSGIVLGMLYGYFNVGGKTSLAIAFVTFIGTFITLDDRLQAPKIEVIQRTIGFYAYSNIYSALTEAMYKNAQGGPAFNAATGNFDDLSDALKARLDLERQTIANRKYIWTIGFALLATTVALTKLSVELERITRDANMSPLAVIDVRQQFDAGKDAVEELPNKIDGDGGSAEEKATRDLP